MMFRANAQHTGVYDQYSPTNTPLGVLKWKNQYHNSTTSPVVVGNTVFFGKRQDHNVYALDTETGSEKWNYTTNGNINTPVVVYHGILYAGTDGDYGKENARLYALNITSGESIWQYVIEEKDMVHAAPTISNNILFIITDKRYLIALDAKTGLLKWRNSLDYDSYSRGGSSSPAIENNIVYVGEGVQNKSVHALNSDTGDVIWKTDTGQHFLSSPAIANGLVYVSSHGYEQGNITNMSSCLMALDMKTGSIQWTYQTNKWIDTTPAVLKDMIFFGCDDTYLYALDAYTGALKWKFKGEHGICSSPSILHDRVYFCDAGKVYALDTQTGEKIWEYDTSFIDSICSSPVIANGTLYVGDTMGRFYAIG